MRNWKPILTFGIAAAMLMMLTGCDSEPVAPNDNPNIDAATAEQWSAQTLEMISEMAASVPSVSEGDFSNVGMSSKSVDEPTWDEEQMAWVMDVTESFSEGDPVHSSGETHIAVWIQFRNDEGALPSPLGATQMEYRASSGMVLDSTEEGVAHMEFEFGTEMTVSYLDNGYGIEGTGAASISASHTTDQGSESMSFAVGYGMDLFTPLEGCPAGPAWVTAGQFRTDALYDGQGMVSWNTSGPGYAAEGADEVVCGFPAEPTQ